MTVLPPSAIVLLSFLAIVRAAVGFNSLDATELFLFFWYGSAEMALPCAYTILFRPSVLVVLAHLQSYLHIQYMGTGFYLLSTIQRPLSPSAGTCFSVNHSSPQPSQVSLPEHVFPERHNPHSEPLFLSRCLINPLISPNVTSHCGFWRDRYSPSHPNTYIYIG